MYPILFLFVNHFLIFSYEQQHIHIFHLDLQLLLVVRLSTSLQDPYFVVLDLNNHLVEDLHNYFQNNTLQKPFNTFSPEFPVIFILTVVKTVILCKFALFFETGTSIIGVIDLLWLLLIHFCQKQTILWYLAD